MIVRFPLTILYLYIPLRSDITRKNFIDDFKETTLYPTTFRYNANINLELVALTNALYPTTFRYNVIEPLPSSLFQDFISHYVQI